MSGTSGAHAEAVVESWLRERGFEEAANALKTRLQAPETTGAGAPRTLQDYAAGLNLDFDESSPVSRDQLVFWAVAGRGGAAMFRDGYRKLDDWVFASLDAYKLELHRALFPLFVHCFLELVARGHTQDAAAFFRQHCNTHHELHASELQQLGMITTQQHLHDSDYAQRALRSKFEIEMSAYAFELLRCFMDDTSLFFLLAMLNRRVNVRLTSMQPHRAQQKQVGEAATVAGAAKRNPSARTVAALAEDSGGGASSVPAATVHWGVPSYLASPAVRADGEEAPPELLAQAEGWNTSVRALRSRRSEPAEAREADDAEACAELDAHPEANSAGGVPSCVCYTVCNARQSALGIAVSAGASHVAAAMADSSVHVWRNDGRTLSGAQAAGGDGAAPTVHITPDDEDEAQAAMHGHHGPAYAAAFSPDQRHLLSCSADATARLWDVQTASCVECYRGHSFPVWDVCFSPVGYYFATASYDRTARLWSTERAAPLRLFAGHSADVECVRFHPNCNYILTGSLDKTARLWDVHSGNCVRVFTGHFDAVSAAVVSPDGQLVATAGADALINLWDIGSGKKISTLHGHSAAVRSLDFSVEGSMLASGSDDCSVMLWRVPSAVNSSANEQQPVKTLYTKNTPLAHVGFTTRNLLVAAGSFGV
eukprot:g5107.t1